MLAFDELAIAVKRDQFPLEAFRCFQPDPVFPLLLAHVCHADMNAGKVAVALSDRRTCRRASARIKALAEADVSLVDVKNVFLRAVSDRQTIDFHGCVFLRWCLAPTAI